MKWHPSSIAAWSVLISSMAASAPVARAEGAFDGEWRTSAGIVTLKQVGNSVTGMYGNGGQFTLKGTMTGKQLVFDYQQGDSRGDGHWTLDDSHNAFQGGYKLRSGEAGAWLGWRPDPQAPRGKTASVGGIWLTDLGLMELEQTGDRFKGRYAVRGVSELEGMVTGRRLEFSNTSFRSGKGWFDLSTNGTTFAGAAVTDGFTNWYGWNGRKAVEFVRHVKLVAGRIVNGSTEGLLTYAVRAPEGYRQGDGKKWPAIVILHGSNMNGKAYVSTIAAAWPDIARDYLLIGMNGEQPSSIGDDPRFNYTYVDYVGRSTYKGFPGTDRESPALVAEALAELRKVYPITRYFVGGHSQGGFLTYSLLMNFPDQIAGAFPISAGVIFQCEPSAYADEKLRAAQRSVPLVIVHCKQDPVVNFSSGEYAAVVFGEAGWPAFHFLADDTPAGHRFGLLPVGEAIHWLEAHATDDPARLVDFAQKRLATGNYRDVIAALNRARSLNPGDAARQQLDRLARHVDAKASAGSKQFLPQIRNEAGTGAHKPWIDDFLAYRDEFEFAPAAREVMEAFAAIRNEHEAAARKALDEANAAFQNGRRDEGYARYQEIVDKYYAASSYRNAKRWLAERK